MNCPIDTWKDSPSDAACSDCGKDATSPEGSTRLSDCVCGLQKIRPADSYICQCIAGQYPGLFDGACGDCPINTYKDSPSDDDCTPCPENSISAAGSTVCHCKDGFSGENGGVCSICGSGKYSVKT